MVKDKLSEKIIGKYKVSKCINRYTIKNIDTQQSFVLFNNEAMEVAYENSFEEFFDKKIKENITDTKLNRKDRRTHKRKMKAYFKQRGLDLNKVMKQTVPVDINGHKAEETVAEIKESVDEQ